MAATASANNHQSTAVMAANTSHGMTGGFNGDTA